MEYALKKEGTTRKGGGAFGTSADYLCKKEAEIRSVTEAEKSGMQKTL